MRKIRPFLFLAIPLLFIMVGAAMAKDDISVTARLDTSQLTVGETAILTLEIRGDSDISITMPEVENLRFTRQGQSSSFNMINGKVSSSVSYSYLVDAEEPGRYTIPPISVEVDGKRFNTKPLPLSFSNSPVSKPGGSGQIGDNQEIAFLQVDGIGKHYLGERVPIRIRAFFRQGGRVEVKSAPVLEGGGIVMNLLSDQVTKEQEVVGGESYSVLNWNGLLTGISAGTQQLRFRLDTVLYVQSRNRQRGVAGGGLLNDPFFRDPFFDNFFGSYTKKPLRLMTQKLPFEVLPLPAKGRPADFNGAVGNFTMKVEAQPKEVEVGEPITLTIKISGDGDLDRVTPPRFPANPAWKSYQPTSRIEQSEKIIEQAIVPKSDTITAIPAISLSYFSPETKDYVHLPGRSIPIKVHASTLQNSSSPGTGQPEKVASPPAPVPEQTNSPEPGKPRQNGGELVSPSQLVPLKLQPGSFSKNIRPMVRSSWYIGTILFLVILVCIAVVYRLIGSRFHNHQTSKNLRRTQLDQLERLKKLRDDGKDREFLFLSRDFIQAHLGRSWGREPGSISLTDLQTRLQPGSSLIALFEAAQAVAYGGEIPDDAQLNSWHQELKEVLLHQTEEVLS